MKKNFVLFLAILLVSVSACKNPFFKNMLDKNSGNASSVPEKPQLPNPQEPAVPENPANPEVPEPQLPKYTLTFGVDGANGTLKATVDGETATEASPISVEKDKTVTFTADPDPEYEVKEWKVDGAAISNTANSYTHTVTKAVDVKVSFDAPFVEGGASLILSPDKLTIHVLAKTADNSSVRIEGCTETELTSGTLTVLHAKGTLVTLKGNITLLDVGHHFHHFNNNLIALNVQGCTALQKLYCSENRLKSLDVQGLPLQELYCGGNRLKSLDVQGLPLQELSCWKNQLTSLDVQGLSDLRYLACIGNRLTSLNVQGLTALQGLYCEDNQLTALNVQGLSALRELDCRGNQLTTLNVQGLSALRELDCRGNQLIALNVQGCTALQKLDCRGNQLTTLNVQGLSALRELGCRGNQLTAEAFTQIFTDLPQRTAGDRGYCYLYTEQTGEGNCKDFTTPAELQAAFQNAKNVKKLKMYKVNTSGYGEEI